MNRFWATSTIAKVKDQVPLYWMAIQPTLDKSYRNKDLVPNNFVSFVRILLCS